MSKTELLIWTATFAAHFKETGDGVDAARHAAEAVDALRHLDISQLQSNIKGDNTAYYAIFARTSHVY